MKLAISIIYLFICYTAHGHIVTIMAGHVTGFIGSSCGFNHQVAPHDVAPQGGTYHNQRGDHRALLSSAWSAKIKNLSRDYNKSLLLPMERHRKEWEDT